MQQANSAASISNRLLREVDGRGNSLTIFIDLLLLFFLILGDLLYENTNK
jgi:hypothetical protein